jgi:hypothetical protein
MDDVFNDQPQDEQQPGQQPAEQQPAGGSTVEGQPGQPGDGGAPTAPENDKHVPLAALEAERRGRQDWKEKAIRYEEELKALRERTAPAQSQQQPQQLDPIQQVRQEMLNERFNMSEMVARGKYADLDDVVETFKQACQTNPALGMALQQSANPYEYAYREGKRLQLLKEVGDDPAAYRAKVEAEIRAQLQPQTPAGMTLPASLAGARSAATRSAPAFTGPTPLGSVFDNR